MKLITGMDEIATETKKSEGWCYFCIPEKEYFKFEKDVKDLLSQTTKLKSFHGKKFKVDHAYEYEQFLIIIRKYVETSVPAILSCTLNSVEYKNKFLQFCERLTENVFTEIGVEETQLIEVCKHFTPGLFTFMRLVNHFGCDNQITIYVDSDSVKEKFPKLTSMIKENKVSANSLMTKLYNAYRNNRFANSPLLLSDGISVLKDEKSIAIQAADVIGNFSSSYIYYKTGNISKKRKLKGQIFEKVFGDKFGSLNFGDSIKLVGENDFELLIDGAITMEFTSYHE